MDLREAGGNMHLHCHNLQWKVRMIIKRIESLLTLELSERERKNQVIDTKQQAKEPRMDMWM